MARLNDPWNTDRLRQVRAEQTDPLVQHLVVRKTTSEPFARVAADAALAVRRAARFVDDPQHAELYRLWLAQSFRKIALRATGGQFERMVGLMDCEVVGDVAALPPMRRSTRDRLFDQMQNLVMLRNPEPLPAFTVPSEGLTCIVNLDLVMSHGKALAQVAHGALRPAWPDHAVDSSLPVTVVGATTAEIERIERDHDVWVVQDAGFTEVVPGSEIVLVIVSGDEAWFRTSEWQAKEREASEQASAGQGERFTPEESVKEVARRMGLPEADRT